MLTQLTHFSSYAKNILNGQTTGFVHSVYHRTINLSVAGHIIAVQAKDTPLSPLSLQTMLDVDSFASLRPVTHGTIHIEKDSIMIPLSNCADTLLMLHFNPANASAMHLDRTLSRTQLLWSAFLLKEAIHRCVHISSESDGLASIFQDRERFCESLIFEHIRKLLQTADFSFRHNAFDEASDALSKLVGVGIGLTPSGDDFLCGMLSGIALLEHKSSNVLSFESMLKKEVRESLSRTNEISQEYLLCALEGRFSAAVLSLSQLLTATRQNTDFKTFDITHTDQELSHIIDQIAALFRPIGHSSGIDTLCGIFFAFELLA